MGGGRREGGGHGGNTWLAVRDGRLSLSEETIGSGWEIVDGGGGNLAGRVG